MKSRLEKETVSGYEELHRRCSGSFDEPNGRITKAKREVASCPPGIQL